MDDIRDQEENIQKPNLVRVLFSFLIMNIIKYKKISIIILIVIATFMFPETIGSFFGYWINTLINSFLGELTF